MILHDPKEEEEGDKEVIAAMCHSADTYSSIQISREDNKYFKQFNW